MLRVSSKFGAAFLALSLTALISVLAACGDSGSTGSGPGEVSSSSQSNDKISSEKQGEVIAIITADVGGEGDKTLSITAEVTTADPEVKFHRIDIVLSDGTPIAANVAKGEYTYQLQPSPYYYDFSGKDFCDGQEYQVKLLVYLESNPSETDTEKFATFKRNPAKCDPPSSSSVSSSSVAVLTFAQIKFGGQQDTLVLNSTDVGTRGVIFGSATGTDNISLANIYYDGSGNAGKIIAGSNVTIITRFDRSQGSGKFNQGSIANYENNPPNAIISPSTSSQFVFVPSAAETSLDYDPGIYYVIRTNNSSGELWTTNDYLMAIPDEIPKQGTGNNRTIKIAAWKIQ